MFYVYADLCSLLAATSQFSILTGQKMQLTGCHNGNEMRNATCVDTQISIEWPYCSFLYCGSTRKKLACFYLKIGTDVLTLHARSIIVLCSGGLREGLSGLQPGARNNISLSNNN